MRRHYVPRGATLAERLAFYSRLEWQGSTDGKAGYGKLRWHGRMQYAHVLAWVAVNGPVPPGQVVRHSCDNPPCIDLEHLLLGTQADNVRDSFDRGRAAPRHGEANNAAKLTAAQVEEIRQRREQGALLRELAEDYGMCLSQISNIVRNEHWSNA